MRASAPASFRKVRPGLEWLGWWSVIFVMFGIVLYYCVVISWCLNYVRYAIQIAWGEDTNAFFFKEFLQLSSGPGEVGSIRPPIILGLAVVWFLNWIITFKGVKKGIEAANKIFIPLLFLLTATLVVWSITFAGSTIPALNMSTNSPVAALKPTLADFSLACAMMTGPSTPELLAIC